MMKKILDDIAMQEESMLTFLEELVNIDSCVDNPEGIEKVACIVGAKLEEIGFTVQYIDNPGVCTHLLAHRKGEGSKKVMIMGHMDTVFPKGTAAIRPFKLENDKAYAPGVLDMKGGITVSLFALLSMCQNGWKDKNITVAFVGDEEPGHPETNAVEILEREAHGMDAVFNIESGRVDGGVVIGRKGVAMPELFIKGQSAHAGNDPENGASALREMSYKLIELEKLTDLTTGTVVNVGLVKGGISPSVVADEAFAKLSVRCFNMEEADHVMAKVRSIVSKSYVAGTQTTMTKENFLYIPMETNPQVLSLFNLVQEQGKKLGLEEIKGHVMGAGSDAAWPARMGVPVICSMGPRGGFNHSDREFIFVDSLVERAKLLALCVDAV